MLSRSDLVPGTLIKSGPKNRYWVWMIVAYVPEKFVRTDDCTVVNTNRAHITLFRVNVPDVENLAYTNPVISQDWILNIGPVLVDFYTSHWGWELL